MEKGRRLGESRIRLLPSDRRLEELRKGVMGPRRRLSTEGIVSPETGVEVV